MHLFQAEVGKKRPAGSASKTPISGKKAKLVSSDDEKQKTGMEPHVLNFC